MSEPQYQKLGGPGAAMKFFLWELSANSNLRANANTTTFRHVPCCDQIRYSPTFDCATYSQRISTILPKFTLDADLA
jgi:hypothetical protein